MRDPAADLPAAPLPPNGGGRAFVHRLASALAFGLLLGLSLVSSAGCDDQAASSGLPSTRAPQMLSDRAGPIEEWILFVAEEERRLFLDTQAALIDAASPTTRFRLVHASPSARNALELALIELEFERWDMLQWLEWDTEVPPWARDHFLMGQDGRGHHVYYLFHPSHYPQLQLARSSCSWASLSIAMRLGGDHAQVTRARLEGGALVADGAHAFLTDTYLDLAVQKRDFVDREEVRGYLERTYGRTLVELASPFGTQSAHTDLFVMPVGGRRVVLGDPDMAKRIVDALPPSAHTDFASRVAALVGALPEDADLRRVVRTPPLARLVQDSSSPRVRKVFERNAEALTALGYEVIRIPWLSMDPSSSRVATVLSYANVILEDDASGSVAYMPVYGIEALDDAAAAVWKALGFEVRRIPALGPALRGGAVRCLSQTLRSPL